MSTRLPIVSGGVTDFWVIRSDFARETEVQAAVQLRRAIIDATGTEPGISTDWEKNPTYEHEIIIGETLRETDGFIDRIALGETGYIIKEENGKIYIAGGSDLGTELAVKRFMDEFVTGAEISVPIGCEIVEYHQYEINEFYIAMNRVDASWRIIKNVDGGRQQEQLDEAVERLRTVIYEKTGLWLEIVENVENTDKAFVISDESPEIDGVYEIKTVGDSLVFSSSASKGIAPLINLFLDRYLVDVYGNYNFPADFRYFDLGDYIIVTYPENSGK